LFLGDQGHHQPRERFGDLEPVLAARGIDLTYTEDAACLDGEKLSSYDGLIVFANITELRPEGENALLDYVASGRGFIPIHCASYCFLNSPAYVELVGAQFLRHGTGVFRDAIAEPEHPSVKGFGGFQSWDETYVHHRHHEKDRLVLAHRIEGETKEPWTWVRTHGKGRVFYTAWGHDARTWSHPGFHNLIERGVRWAVGGDPSVVPPYSDPPEMTPLRRDVEPFEYADAEVPFYPSGRAWGVTGEPIRKMQKPLAAAESVKHMVTPVGFEVRVFASDPEVQGKPIAMNWDERGRLWVLETVDYPNEIQREGEGRDRIRIYEDTDGDGRADRFKVFAEKLSIPASLTFANGGVIVHQIPHTLFLKDTDGDDAADERRVLFTGWSTADTHAGPSNLQYGLDNWIYGMVGYAGFEGEVGGERHSFRTGFYRFRPDGSKLEFLRNTNNNSWGVGFTEDGVLLGSTANGNPSVYLPVPNRYYEAVRGWSSSVLGGIAESPAFHPITDKVRQVDHHGNFTAGAGHAVYTARNYPRQYWNSTAFVCGPTGHLVATFQLQRLGANVRSRNAWNLLASDDEWTAPTAAEVGPDGNVWVIDWYNYIVQHNPTPRGYRTGKGAAYETELRDKKHGRILRVVHKDASPRPAPSLQGASGQALVEALRSDNFFWRRHAQRLLVERRSLDVAGDLIRLASASDVDEVGLNTAAIHALWTLHGLGALDGSNAAATAAAVAGLRHRSAGVRRAAVSVLPRTEASVAALVASRVHRDADGHVRLAALLALAETPPSRSGAAAVFEALSERTTLEDRWLADAATCAAAAHDAEFLALLASQGRGVPESDALARLLNTVAEHHARGEPGEGTAAVIVALEAAPVGVSEAVIAGLARGWPEGRRFALGDHGEEALRKVLVKLSSAGKSRLITLAARWGVQGLDSLAVEIRAALLAQAVDEKATDAARGSAAAQWIDLKKSDPKAAATLLDLITPQASPELSRSLLEAVGRSESSEVGAEVAGRLSAFTPALKTVALRVLLGRGEWTRALLDALEGGSTQLSDLALDQRQALAAHPDEEVARRAKALLARGGGLPDPDRQKVFDELLPLAKRSGDAALGKQVFLKQCAKCHVHGAEGTRIGPDLTGMAVHPKEELLTQIIDPSRNVEGNFRVYTLVTRDGKFITGLLASESRTSLEIIDSEAQKHTVLREEVQTLAASPKSLMPEGFEKTMPPEDIVHVLEFLTQRGRYLPLPLDKVASAVSTRGMFFSEDSAAERLVFADWSPKTCEGVPFQLVDPQGGRLPNVVLLYGPQGRLPPRMPRAVKLPCNTAARAIHLLSGISGWGFPLGEKGSVSMIVRLHYEGGAVEDHPLLNGEHFADYIRRVDVPGSKFAFRLRSQQVRYLVVEPERHELIREIELVKGPDATAPIVVAVTVELEG
jgi:hypothetical protein